MPDLPSAARPARAWVRAAAARLAPMRRRQPIAQPPRTDRSSWADRTSRRVKPATKEAVSLAPRWELLTQRTLTELQCCDPAFRPTNFWGPGVDKLLEEMRTRGLESFKSWPEALFWFYPVYELSLRRRQRKQLLDMAESFDPPLRRQLRARLDGAPAAQRDFDAARLTWDHDRWPVDLEAHGESTVGRPRHLFRLTGSETAWGRPYLNYLLCMAALSRHVRTAPKSFLELGGGFGVLGELVMSRDPEARYVNCDIPPLLTVASYYLTTLFGDDRVLTYDDQVSSRGPIEVPRSACLPNWRIGDLKGPFDVFVNAFSFQEMEPEVVQRYVDTVVGLGISHVVSLNSRKGKRVAQDEHDIGVLDPVTSTTIVAMFEAHGYTLRGAYNSPLVAGAGELVILSRM
jgi:putative sugar O-methyltransferase